MTKLNKANNNIKKNYSIWSEIQKQPFLVDAWSIYKKNKYEISWDDLVKDCLKNIKKSKLSSEDLAEVTSEIIKYCKQRKNITINHKPLVEEAERVGFDPTDNNHYWYKSKFISAFNKPKKISYEEVAADVIKDMINYSPSYPEAVRIKKITDPHLFVIDAADVHIGKRATNYETGEEYNSEIAVERVLTGVRGLLDKAQNFPKDKILLIIGNDILHTDSPKRTTTSGTPQDTDGMWYENFLTAKKLYVDVIEMLMGIADVHVVYNPSNHDYTHGFFLAQVIETWFMNSKNVTFDTSISHRKYYKYGKCLIGTTHGDGAKNQDLPLLMANEVPKEWGSTIHRYLYTHHIHHKTLKDYVGVTVESLRSPSSADSWHHRNGYQHNPKAVEGFIHHPKDGQIAKFSHIFY